MSTPVARHCLRTSSMTSGSWKQCGTIGSLDGDIVRPRIEQIRAESAETRGARVELVGSYRNLAKAGGAEPPQFGRGQAVVQHEIAAPLLDPIVSGKEAASDRVAPEAVPSRWVPAGAHDQREPVVSRIDQRATWPQHAMDLAK